MEGETAPVAHALTVHLHDIAYPRNAAAATTEGWQRATCRTCPNAKETSTMASRGTGQSQSISRLSSRGLGENPGPPVSRRQGVPTP